MKFILGLFTILTITGLGQTHQFPDFGKGPLHEDFQDILDLVPTQDFIIITLDYLLFDNEVQNFLEELDNKTVIKDLLVDLQAIPEVTNLLNYLRKEGINVYNVINTLNKIPNIKELATPDLQKYTNKVQRTGGIYGFFKDIKQAIDYDAFISMYVDKLKASTAFVNFTEQLKSNNFQQLINKFCKINSVQFIGNRLKDSSVDLKIFGDIMYLLFGINAPSPLSKTLPEEFADFVLLLPIEKFLNVIIEYINEDEKVQNAILFMFTTDFHDLLRSLEGTKEHQALVVYLEKAGVPVIEALKSFHHAIGMEGYVPPKIEELVKSLIKTQKIGDGMQGMLKDLHNLLPLDEIDNLYQKKMRTSKIYIDFVGKITSEEMKKIVVDIGNTKIYAEFLAKTTEKGLDFEGMAVLNTKILGIKGFK